MTKKEIVMTKKEIVMTKKEIVMTKIRHNKKEIVTHKIKTAPPLIFIFFYHL